MAAETEFRAMGTDIHLVVVGPESLLACGRALIDDLEQRWSRFLPDSEISRLNRHAGETLGVSWQTRELVQRAVEAWRMSGGGFDPTVLGAVLRAGYDRTFEEIRPDQVAPGSLLRQGADDIEISGNTVRLPPGIGFDPGGIGKGLAADLVVADLLQSGADGVCANLGGDVRVAGEGPDGGGWTIAIEHAWREAPLALVGVGGGAVATSTTLKRRWTVGGEARHHLIDPMTGLPSDTDVNHASVICTEAWAAEVLAKAVLLRGMAHPFDILGGTGAAGLAVGADGTVAATPGFAGYLGGASLPTAISPPR